MMNYLVTCEMYLVLLMTFFAGFDEWGKDHNEMSEKVLCLCRQANVKLNKDKCLFRCTSIPFFNEIIS